MDTRAEPGGETAPDPLEEAITQPADAPERTANVLGALRAAIGSRGAAQAALRVLDHLEQLGPAAAPALVVLLDLPEPPLVDRLLAAGLPLATRPDSLPQLARLVLRGLVRWGDPRLAQSALGPAEPGTQQQDPAGADDEAAGWRGFADRVRIAPDVRLLMEALVHARLDDSRAAVGALAEVKALGRPVQAVAMLEQMLQIALAAGDRPLLNSVSDLVDLVPPEAGTLLLEELGRWNEALDALFDVADLRETHLRRLKAHLRRRARVEGAGATQALLLERARRGGAATWAAAFLALRRCDARTAPETLRLARILTDQDPTNRLLAEALEAATTCWGDLPAVRALWDERLNGSDAEDRPVLRAIAALRLGRAPDFARSLDTLELSGWAAAEPDEDNLVILYTLADETSHPEIDRIWRFVERLSSAHALELAQAARLRGAEGLALRLAARLEHATDLPTEDMERVGDLFALHGAEREAFEVYRRIRPKAPSSRELGLRLLTSLESDEELLALVEAGESSAVLDHLATYLAAEMRQHAFEVRRLLRPAEVAALSPSYAQALPARPFHAPHARFSGDPPVWRAEVVEHPPVYGAVVQDAEVVGGSTAVLVGGHVIYPPLEAPNAVRYGHRDAAAIVGRNDHLVVRLGPLTRTVPAAVNLVGFGASNYYHWLYDICSRFVGLRALGAPPQDAVILVDEAALAVPQLQEVLARLNTGDLPLSPVAVGERVAVGRLVTASPAAWGPFHLRGSAAGFEPADSVILPEAVQLLRDLVRDEFAAADGPRRILLTRHGLANARLQNEPEIAALLEERFGFEVVDPGRLTFAEQVRVFASAEAIVGASGAAMANLAFCRRWATVFCLMADRYDYSAWPTLAEAAGAEVVYVTGQIQEFSRNRNHSPFTIDPHALAEALVASGFG